MEVLLLLGGNLGDVVVTLDRAEALIAERVGPLRSRSRDYWTEPWGFHDDRIFLNRALVVETDHSPEEALRLCLGIERELGRVRQNENGYASRPIDIDLLLWGGTVIDLSDLRVPHPRMHERAFALAPASDVAPDWSHPLLQRTVLTLLNDVLRSA